jgi:hypothetical protein
MDLRGFFVAIIADWVALMSGIASVALTILGVVRRWEVLPRRALWIAALVCFFIAAARVWTDEHRARLAAEKRLEQLTIPDLSGVIDFVSVAPAGENAQDSIITLYAEIKNLGAPSVVDTFSMKVRSKDGKEVVLLSLGRPSKDVQLFADIPGQYGLLPVDEFLPIKAITQPVPKGGKTYGWTWGLAKGIRKTELMNPESRIFLSFDDVTGKTIEVVSPVISGIGMPPTLDLLQNKLGKEYEKK